MLKFDFAIHTRSGKKVESIVIAGHDRADAERKLNQMYRQCAIVRCAVRQTEDRSTQATSMEDILTLISE